MKALDTDILVGILRKNEDAIRKYEQIDDEISTTAFNAQELLFGALVSMNAGANFKEAKELLSQIGQLTYEEAGMIETVKIQVYLEKTGRRIGLIDEMIAGVCMAHNAAIVTRNIGHFSKIQKLKIDKW